MSTTWLIVVLLLAGCGSGGHSRHPAATSSPTPIPAASPTATVLPSRAFAVGRASVDPGNGLDAYAIVRSDDDGASWDVINNITHRVHALAFVDAQTGWFTGERDIDRSDDGGISWVGQLSRTSEYFDISFISRTRGIVAGRIVDFVGAAELLATEDGQQWTVLGHPQSAVFERGNLERACLTESGSGVALGSVDDARVVLGIRDDHASEISDRLPAGSITASACAGAGDLWLGGRARVLLHSPDGGTTWNDVSATIADLFDGDVAALDFVDEQNGWLAATASGDGEPVVLRTIDRGATWTRQDLPAIGAAAIRALDFGSARHGMLALEVHAGDVASPAVLVTNDGGLSWQRHALPDLRTVEDVSVAP